MGKMLICSKADDFSVLDNFFARVGFEKAFENRDNIITGTYYKTRVRGQNFQRMGSDYVIGTGTYIYENEIAEKALKKILIAFKAGVGVATIQQKTLGAYCLCLCVDGKLTIFVDKNNLYAIYYYCVNGRFVLTNTYYHIAKLIGDLQVDEANFIEKELLFGDVFGPETIYRDISTLSGDQIIYIDENSDCQISSVTRETAKANEVELKEAMVERYRIFNSLFQEVAMLVTGGSDSRLVASLLNCIGIKAKGYYFLSDSYTLPSRPIDSQIAKELMTILGHEFIEIYCPTKEVATAKTQQLLYRFGELSNLWGGNPIYFEALAKEINCDFIDLGLYGELFNCTPINKKGKHIVIDDFINPLILAIDGNNVAYLKSNKQAESAYLHMISKWRAFCHAKGIDDKNIKKQELYILDFEMRKKRDRAQLNLMNVFFYSFPILHQPFMDSKIASIDWHEKASGKYKTELTLSLNATAYDLPLYSHTKLYTYDKEKKKLISKDNPLILKLRCTLLGRIHNPFMLHCVKSIYYLMMRDMKGYLDLRADYKRKSSCLKELRERKLEINLEPLDYLSYGHLWYLSAVINMIEDSHSSLQNSLEIK